MSQCSRPCGLPSHETYSLVCVSLLVLSPRQMEEVVLVLLVLVGTAEYLLRAPHGRHTPATLLPAGGVVCSLLGAQLRPLPATASFFSKGANHRSAQQCTEARQSTRISTAVLCLSGLRVCFEWTCLCSKPGGHTRGGI